MKIKLTVQIFIISLFIGLSFAETATRLQLFTNGFFTAYWVYIAYREIGFIQQAKRKDPHPEHQMD